VVNGKDGAVVGRGTGREGTVSFTADSKGACRGTVSFMPVVVTAGTEARLRLIVPSATTASGTKSVADQDGVVNVTFDFARNTAFSVMAAYAPRRGKR